MAQLDFITPVVRAIGGLSTDDPFEEESFDSTLDPWDERFFFGARRQRRWEEPEPAPTEGFEVARWMADQQNGRIPTSAMVFIGLRNYNGTKAFLRPDAAAAWAAAVAAAKADGVDLEAAFGNAYRSYDWQASLYAAYQSGTGGMAASPGNSNHGWGIAVDIAEAGKARDWLIAHGEAYGWSHPIPEDPPHFEYTGGGTPPKGTITSTEKRGTKRVPIEQQPELAPLGLVAGGAVPFSSVLAELFMPSTTLVDGRSKATPKFSGSTASVKRQLWQGFMDAGRPDLAKMVSTPEFATWIGAESGWRVDAVSPYFPNHGRNYGLFQFAQIHLWTADYITSGKWMASAYQQAKLVARYFPSLSAADIRTYAAQVKAGTYRGWPI